MAATGNYQWDWSTTTTTYADILNDMENHTEERHKRIYEAIAKEKREKQEYEDAEI